MPRLFRPNFEFEHQLAHGPNWQPPRKLKAVNLQWADRMLALAAKGDFLWLPELNELESQTTDRLREQCEAAGVTLTATANNWKDAEVEFVPWGWSEPMVKLAEQHRWRSEHPELEVVKWTNSRQTSFQYEHEWGIAPEGSCVIENLSDLDEAITSLGNHSGWVVKAEFGMSGRERIPGEGRTMAPPVRQWCGKRIESGMRLFFEPWLDKIDERSFHFQITPDGQVRELGSTRLQTDSAGRYLGNDVTGSSEFWEQSRAFTFRFATTAAQRGYFGPISIDSMRYRTAEGEIRERPLQDVNGRFSMGRCEWERHQRKKTSPRES